MDLRTVIPPFMQYGTIDPSVVATPGSIGFLYLKLSAPSGLFQKRDNGTTVNWENLSPVGGSANRALSNLTAPTSLNESLLFQNTGAKNVKTADNGAGATSGINLGSGLATGATSGLVTISTGGGNQTGNLQIFSGIAIGPGGFGFLGTSGQIEIQSGNSELHNTGLVSIASGNPNTTNPLGGGSSGNVNIQTGSNASTNVAAASGAISIFTGGTAGAQTGHLTLQTGSTTGALVNTGVIFLTTGASINGDSGDVQMKTGLPAGTGIRGRILANARDLRLNDPANFNDTGPAIDFEGLRQFPLLDNQAVAVTFATYPVTYEALFLEVLIRRGADRHTEIYHVTTNGVAVAINNAGGGAQIGVVGVTLSAIVVGANVEIQYTSTNTGVNPEIFVHARKMLP